MANKNHVQPKRFTLEERKLIEGYLRDGLRFVDIGKLMNRNRSSINFEVARGGGRDGYNAVTSHVACLNAKKVPTTDLNIQCHLMQKRIENIEFQLEIITNQLEDILNGQNH